MGILRKIRISAQIKRVLILLEKFDEREMVFFQRVLYGADKRGGL